MNKQTLYLGGAVVVLLLIYLLLKTTSVPTAQVQYLVDIDTSEVTEVTIYHDGTTVTLQNDAGEWMVTNPYTYRANLGFVVTLLQKLGDMRLESEVTHNADRWAEFEVDTSGTRITVHQGNRRDDFIIGKTATGYRQSYARLEGENTVYLIRGSYGSAVNRTADNWRDKAIADFEQDDVLRIVTEDFEILKQGEEEWQVTPARGESFAGDNTAVRRVTGALARLRTADFPEAADYEDVNWDRPDNEVTVELASGDSRTIRFYQDENQDNRYFVKYGNVETVYRVFRGGGQPGIPGCGRPRG